MASYGYTFQSGDVVTPPRLNDARTVSNIVNADISASAAIDKTKISGTAVTVADTGTVTSAMIADGTIVNADINASAAIAHSKLANITAGQVLLGNASNVPTATALSGDVTINSSGVTAIGAGVIVDADINASAAIADTKLATISTAGKVSNSATTATSDNTASAIVARDGSGNFSAGTVTAALTGNVTGNVTGSSGSCTGNSATATTLATGRNFQLAGDVTSSAVSFNGSAAVTLTGTIANDAVTTAKLATVTQQALVPAGAIMPFAMNSAPSGWLAADGSAVSRSTYATLFSAIDTTHGVGDGSTTFNLPDLRGIFVRGSGSQTVSGTSYSGTFAAKQQDAFKSHSHPTYGTESGYRHAVRKGADAIIDATSTSASVNDAEYQVDSRTDATGDTETRPANIALLYCIKF